MATAGTISVGDSTPVKLFDSEEDGGKAAVYMVNPSGGKVLIGVVGMPGSGDAAAAPSFPVPDGVREYLSLDRIIDGFAEGMITQVWALSDSGTIDVDHGVAQARR